MAKTSHQAGDKMAGRHGNKGVVSNILPVEDDAARCQWCSSRHRIEPIGCAVCMNVGQISRETHLGMAAKGLGEEIDKMLKAQRTVI